MKALLSRRVSLQAALALAAALFGGCSTTLPPAADAARPPIVFVHGNGDTSALWHTTVWRFESNGWPRERLHAIDVPYPLARDDDTKPQDGRTSTTEHMQYLSMEVDRVLAATGARQVVLFGNSRGGNAIRNYIANGGGAAKVSHAILGGTPNHGVWADAALRPGSEFNGAGAFLRALNAPQGANGNEVTPGPQWLTIRSDDNDKFAQPDGVWIGSKGTPTNVGFDGPELKGASNVMIAGIDHRETSFSPQAFDAAFRFITSRAPATLAAMPEAVVVLGGKVSGLGLNNEAGRGNFVNNLALVGARVEVFATDPASGARRGGALLTQTITADGRWGPLRTDAQTALEFTVTAPGFATTHIYRAPFARSSALVNLRAERIADTDRDAASVVALTRPRGYFGLPRDRITLDGQSPPAGIAPGTAGVSVVKLKLTGDAGRAVHSEFNGERIVGRAWPAAENHLVFLELH